MSDKMEKNENQVPVEEFVEVMPLVDILESNDGVMAMKAVSTLRRNGKSLVFKRRFQLADGVDVEKISAKTQDGVLVLSIPKSEEAKVHKIKVC